MAAGDITGSVGLVELSGGERIRAVGVLDVDGEFVDFSALGGESGGGAVPGTPTISPLMNGGSPGMNVDGTTPAEFTAGPTAGATWHVSRVVLQIAGTGAYDPELFGAHAALANGLLLSFGDADLPAGLALSKNRNLELFASAIILSQSETTYSVTFVFDLAAMFGGGAPMELASGETISVTVQDDLSGGGTIEDILCLVFHTEVAP